MDMLHYKGYQGSTELDMDRRVCRGKILMIDDVVTYESPTPDGLEAEFQAAVDDYLETCREIGKAPQKPCSGTFNVRIPPELHRAAVLRSYAEESSLNVVVVKALECYLNGQQQTVNLTVNVPPGAEEAKTIRAVASSSPTNWVEKRVH